MQMTYELTIGICEHHNREKKNCVYRDYLSASTLNVAKARATIILKSLEPMQPYLKGMQGNNITWSAWCKETERKQGHFFTNKESAPRTDNPETIGFCQLTWEHLQLSLFEEL